MKVGSLRTKLKNATGIEDAIPDKVRYKVKSSTYSFALLGLSFCVSRATDLAAEEVMALCFVEELLKDTDRASL